MRYRFGRCELDTAQFALTRDGDEVKLEPKVFDMLAYLVAHAGRVLSRQELLHGVWPGDHVSASVVNKNIFLSRRAIGQDDAPEPIRTVRGRGYRFDAEVERIADAPAPAAPSSAGQHAAPPVDKTRDSPPLVGRETDLVHAGRALAAVEAGHGQLRLISGPAGIGKTRLAESVCELAAGRGFRVLRARCPQGVGLPPLWPWRRILEQSIDAIGLPALQQALGPAREDLAPLLPALAGDDAHAPQPTIDGEAARFRLFGALARCVDALGAHGPHLLFIDDLQWADRTSLGALDFVAGAVAAQRVMLLLATRPGVERQGGGWLGAPHTAEVTLGPLGQDEVVAYTEATLGFPAVPLGQAVFARSEGNPFVMCELLRSLQQSGPHSLDDLSALAARTDVDLPEGARHVVRELLAPLDADARGALEVAAVLGRDFDLRLLSTVTGEPTLALVQTMQSAIDTRVVLPGPGQRFSFSHGLVRDTLYGDIPMTRRSALHMRVAEALEADAAAGRGQDPHALHQHLFLALPHARIEATVEAACAAAEAATRVAAHGDAAEAYARAIAALGYQEGPQAGEALPDLWMRRARALREARELGEAQAAYLQVAERARQRQDAALLARAAIGLRRAQRWRAVPEPQSEELLQEALDALPPSERALRAQLLSYMAGVRDLSRRKRMADRAARLAREVDDPETQHAALAAQLHAAQAPEELAARLGLTDRLLSLATQHDRLDWAWQAHAARHETWLRMADAQQSEAALSQCAHIADALRDPALQWEVWRLRVHGLLCRGALDAALSQMEPLARDGARIEEPFAPFYYLQQMLWLLRERGELEAIRGSFEQSMAPYPWVAATARPVYALVSLELGDLSRAERHYAHFSRQRFDNLVLGEDRLFCAAALSPVAVALGDTEGCGALLGVLGPHAQQLTVNGSLLHLGAAAHFVGLLQQALGREDEAEASLKAGLDIHARTGARPAAARSHLALAGLRRTPDAAHVRAALELARQCGAAALVAQATARL